MKKIISILLTLCFCNLITMDIYGISIPTTYSNNITITNYSLLPVDIGKVVQDTYVLSNTTIINIQDLHSDENTQKNIVSILDFLVNNYNVKNIYFEGAIGNLDFGWLNSIKDENIKKNIANKLLIDGKITGAEYFGFFNKKKNIFFKGLEDEQIYKENFTLLEKMYEKRAVIQKKINDISDKLNTITEVFTCLNPNSSISEVKADCLPNIGYVTTFSLVKCLFNSKNFSSSNFLLWFKFSFPMQ